MSSDVFSARSRAKDLSSAVLDHMFYYVMGRIIDQKLYLKYEDYINGEEYTFDSMLDFLTAEKGMRVEHVGAFINCLRSVQNSCVPASSDAKELADTLEKMGITVGTDVAPLQAHGEIGNGRESRLDNIKSTEGGTSQAYLLRRIARDFPGEEKLVGVGQKYPSVQAAALALGIRTKKTISIAIELDLCDRLQQHCKEHDVPVSVWCRDLIKKELERH